MARTRKTDNGAAQEKQMSDSATVVDKPAAGSESVWVWELEELR
jgi:hypothetical protein